MIRLVRLGLAMSVCAGLLLPGSARLAGQAPADEARYYDFWPGTWCTLVDGRPDPGATCFVVRQGLHASDFHEEWAQVVDGNRLRSRAMRAWDPIEKRWMLVWVSDQGHFQIWNGVKVGADWYIVRAFEQEGRQFLSRQAWIPTGPDRLVRVMERSFDEGATWQTRSRTEFGRMSPAQGNADKIDRWLPTSR